MQLINIHTHQLPAPGEKTILSLYSNFDTATPDRFYSVGIHPWYIDPGMDDQCRAIKTMAAKPNVLAIGETGLDKLCDTDFSMQQKVFDMQVQLAGQLNKPLIIHCVRAWDEVLVTLEKLQATVPVIFHGFNKSVELAKRIIEKGYYLSFGQAVEKPAVATVLQSVPPDRFFLETDDAAITIEEVYKRAAAALSIDMNSLSLQLQKNVTAVFGPSFLV